MRYRLPLLALLVLPLAQCSCQRDADTLPTAQVPVDATLAGASRDEPNARNRAIADASSAAAQAAAATLHA